ncbi:haloacid dehalogenase type II [Staphylococcus condimenti]|uniref:Haloacid dehalogenase type II n=1 Tax=Staphylococcus condimenti TaxID=70255 RepID=A0AB37H304_9STAP|nr:MULTISPECIES: haloacid dehalogenase type II [Staphylococcus]AMY06193.1 2-haloalkanoic acid dehalogenase [Staphylococcus condimenti]APR60072.1 haloacid dehalogenase, type II [Staphylococcus condimenti]OFO99610.1 2-haloalkanoic acid dehalogenase [Staphylococcus sp. HMSC065E08]PNZ64089.1 haloacid dehalogenase type II [Staphylococcus condimenti]QQS82007.1 haloacid dehalogenase type II [Staphylococcus condimenti]
MYKVIVFDAYGTLFDTSSVKEKLDEYAGNKSEAVSKLWRNTQLKHTFLRQVMGRYITFDDITKQALEYALEQNKVPYNHQDINTIFDEYLKLDLFKEVPNALKSLLDLQKKLSVFSNGSMDMLDPVIENAGISDKLDSIISANDIKQYKPSQASYALVLKYYPVKRDEVLFVSSNTWDISGAANFGFDTAWVNRNQNIFDKNGPLPKITVQDLDELVHWLKLN